MAIRSIEEFAVEPGGDRRRVHRTTEHGDNHHPQLDPTVHHHSLTGPLDRCVKLRRDRTGRVLGERLGDCLAPSIVRSILGEVSLEEKPAVPVGQPDLSKAVRPIVGVFPMTGE